ncbi:hypothetical protein [Lignipirellula cremea]|uniref:Uncharacterized protein n=1 Tax=Lignipirellula cremea TaxID=2528010 RepID=A0A518DRL1_9BACT|nr:hypothetical protein [Lignipirellula cremea]QDU94469.1 hypothetical protein Pla8534_22600 [Lignipirellula cremea]
MTEHDGLKGCGPQPFRSGNPNNEWGIDELSFYAQIQFGQILEGERLLTPSYWRLGNALALAKKSLHRGQWAQYLAALGIDKTRASKARAIHRTFPEAGDVVDLTVEEAYDRRQRPATTASTHRGEQSNLQKDSHRLRHTVSKIATRSREAIHDAAFAAPAEAVLLIPAVRKAIQELEQLLSHLVQQAALAD